MISGQDILIKTPLDYFKYPCLVCGQLYWRRSKARSCCKGTPAYAACERQIDQQVAAAEARKHGSKDPSSYAGLGLKPCPRCKGETGHWNCPLCDGCGQVPENML